MKSDSRVTLEFSPEALEGSDCDGLLDQRVQANDVLADIESFLSRAGTCEAHRLEGFWGLYEVPHSIRDMCRVQCEGSAEIVGGRVVDEVGEGLSGNS